ncbi:HotDog domain-containing protein [Pholiota molesta]|nr:HotDog domain-containing protein [Pholiota molesta]KAF8188015.1 HotDog domain-containing protein [Pholiota molesta]
MSSRLALSSSSPLPTLSPDIPSDDSLEPSEASSHQGKSWIDPATLPQYHHPSYIGGNVADYVKRLNYNTLMFYGVGEKGSFGYEVGKSLRFTDVSLQRDVDKHGRLQATTTAELQVTKHMLNGAGMLHGGCVAYLIDNTPLVVLGLVKSVNGVGVTQSLNILFHSPAPLGTCLQIVSTSIALGGRVMSSRCEILDKLSGRMIASAFLSKMQPAKL